MEWSDQGAREFDWEGKMTEEGSSVMVMNQ